MLEDRRLEDWRSKELDVKDAEDWKTFEVSYNQETPESASQSGTINLVLTAAVNYTLHETSCPIMPHSVEDPSIVNAEAQMPCKGTRLRDRDAENRGRMAKAVQMIHNQNSSGRAWITEKENVLTDGEVRNYTAPETPKFETTPSRKPAIEERYCKTFLPTLNSPETPRPTPPGYIDWLNAAEPEEIETLHSPEDSYTEVYDGEGTKSAVPLSKNDESLTYGDVMNLSVFKDQELTESVQLRESVATDTSPSKCILESLQPKRDQVSLTVKPGTQERGDTYRRERVTPHRQRRSRGTRR